MMVTQDRRLDLPTQRAWCEVRKRKMQKCWSFHKRNLYRFPYISINFQYLLTGRTCIALIGSRIGSNPRQTSWSRQKLIRSYGGVCLWILNLKLQEGPAQLSDDKKRDLCGANQYFFNQKTNKNHHQLFRNTIYKIVSPNPPFSGYSTIFYPEIIAPYVRPYKLISTR